MKKFIIIIIIVILGLVFYRILNAPEGQAPAPAGGEAAPTSTFQGPSGPPSGIKGPSEPPPG